MVKEYQKCLKIKVNIGQSMFTFIFKSIKSIGIFFYFSAYVLSRFFKIGKMFVVLKNRKL